MAKIERDLGAIVGESAFEFWKSQPGNEGKTESDFLEFLGGGKNSYHFEKIFEGYDDYIEIQNVETDFEEGSIFLIQLTPRVIYPGGEWAGFSPTDGNNYRMPDFWQGEIDYQRIEDYSMCVLMSSTPLKSSDWSNGAEYVPIRLYANNKSIYKYNNTIKVERLYTTGGMSDNNNYGYDFYIRLQGNNDGSMNFLLEGDAGHPYITSIWKLTK